jgi:hypothetical protein
MAKQSEFSSGVHCCRPVSDRQSCFLKARDAHDSVTPRYCLTQPYGKPRSIAFVPPRIGQRYIAPAAARRGTPTSRSGLNPSGGAAPVCAMCSQPMAAVTGSEARKLWFGWRRQGGMVMP